LTELRFYVSLDRNSVILQAFIHPSYSIG